MRKLLGRGLLASIILFCLSTAASAGVVARIDLSEQRMYVEAGGQRYVWAVSTGSRAGYTHTGTFRPFMLSRHHRSSRYNGAPMPHSVFFDGNIAVHGTTEVGRLGQPASHGCVRLHPDHAATFFNLVSHAGMSNTVITVTR